MSEVSSFSLNRGVHAQVAAGEGGGGRPIGVCNVSLGRPGVGEGKVRWGTRPRLSDGQAVCAVEGEAEDRLIGGARGQVDLDLGFQLDNAGGDLDQAQSQGVELQ
jgi:hypothetical protein